MKKFIALILLIVLIPLAQSKQDILNNLQREGSIDVVDASPDSTYKLLIWDGDEVKLVTVQRLGGADAFDSLLANYIVSGGNLDVGGDVAVTDDLDADTVSATGLTLDGSATSITVSGTPTKVFSAGSYSSKLALASGATTEMATLAGEGAEDDFYIGYGSYMRTTGEDGKGFGLATLVEATNTTGTPTIQGGQMMAFLGTVGGSEAAVLKTRGGDATAGMYGLWLKTGANANATFASGSRTAPLWVDNQASGTHNGEEYGIFASTGASKPDAFVGFETTSSGWGSLFYFDETAYDQDPVASGDATAGSKDYYLKVNINGTIYGIQLYAE